MFEDSLNLARRFAGKPMTAREPKAASTDCLSDLQTALSIGDTLTALGAFLRHKVPPDSHPS